MKKKRLRLVTTIALLAALAGGSGGVAWGQAFRSGYVTGKGKMELRRGNAHTYGGPAGYIVDSTNVNNEFGAGESAIIGNGNVKVPSTSTHPLNTTPTILRVGSEYSKNVVIDIYDSNGGAAGQIINVHFRNWDPYDAYFRNPAYCQKTYPEIHTGSKDGTNDRMFISTLAYDATRDVGSLSGFGSGMTGGDPGTNSPTYPTSPINTLISSADAPPGSSSYYGSVHHAVKINDSTAVFPIHNHISGWDLENFKINIAGAGGAVYTSSRESLNKDDNKTLYYTVPGSLTNPSAYAAAATSFGANAYVRPTTVMVSDNNNSFKLLRMTDIEWWWMPKKGTLGSVENLGRCDLFNSSGCGHFNGDVWYSKQNATFAPLGAQYVTGAYVDGAIRFLKGSRTCVEGNAENETTASGSKAYLVVPEDGLFALRVGGEFQKFHWHRAVAADGETRADWYQKNGGPGLPYPTNHTSPDPVYLYPTVAPTPWAANWNVFPTVPNDNGISSHVQVAGKTVAGSIFGVRGKYSSDNADVHTNDLAQTAGKGGVIEVGTHTGDGTSLSHGTGTATLAKFHIYSGGTLKNFANTCVSSCEEVNMTVTSPSFTIDDDDQPLNILNDGNGSAPYCCAKILLGGASTGVGKLSGAGWGSKQGPLHIQAMGSVEADAGSHLNIPTGGKDNNVAIISNHSYIKLGQLTYDNNSGTGSAGHEGNLTVWAHGDTITGACGGYVSTEALTVKSGQTTNSWLALSTYVPDYSTNLRYDLYCNDQLTTKAAAFNGLDTKLQTRIQSDRDSVHVRGGDFKYEGVKGALLVQGARAVTFDQKAEIKFTGDEGDAAIQSRHSTVTVGQDFNYESTHTKNDLFVDGFGGVYFNGGGKIDMAAATTSNVALQSNAGDVSFSGASKNFLVDYSGGATNTADLDIMAGRDVLFNIPFTSTENNDKINSRVFAGRDIHSTANNADVSFLSTTDNGSTLTWVARRNITTNGILTASYTGAQTGIMAFQAAGGNITTNNKVRISTENTNRVLFSAEMLHPGCGVLNGANIPYTDCTPGNRNKQNGNIYWNDSVTITRTVTSNSTTDILAMNNIRTNQVGITNAAAKDTTNVTSYMGDIWLGYSNPTATNTNRFTYSGTGGGGLLNIKAGYRDATNTNHDGGGNIYFTALRGIMAATKKHVTEISIPYSNEYICGSACDGLLHERKDASMMRYEHSGIIGGLGACHRDKNIAQYAQVAQGTPTMVMGTNDTSLLYLGNTGNLKVDAGKRGNIILNKGALLNFQDDNGDATFRTREGDIDMRDPFDAKKMKGSLLFLAQLEQLGDLSKIGVCGCDEERNNVYLQDFEYKAEGNSGSVFVGADNNIKLNYGGLTNIGTRQDPFLSTDRETYPNGAVKKIGRGYKHGGGCDRFYHCDLDGSENQARDLILDFNGGGTPVTSGGFAAVASDMIDVYKNLIYKGGNGSGLSTVPETGTLHGENVAGYGLFMKTQANKHNWTDNILLQAPKCPTTCAPTGCGEGGRPATAFLHNTVRMTFHSDARFYAENQHVHLESPVIETFGVLELNAEDNAGAKAMITIKTDSLICHDSLIRKGKGKVQLTTWSGLPKDQPIIKLGYSRKAAPFKEYAYDDGSTEKLCRECVTHYKGKVYAPGETPLDTMFVKFGPDTEWERQNVMVVDHTVISFLTDSFDHVKGGDVLHARYFVDTTKIRNQVEFWTDPKHERDGHLELISEEQMGSKDYAGLYTRHLHLEPIGACGRPTSELWLPGLALDVITTSTFGGFGIQYTDVHVENGANLNPGFTSLRLRGQCYEQACGTLTMKDLRLDGGSELHFSVGTTKGLNGEYSDAIDVDRLTTYGPVNVNIEIRPCEKMQKRCYPIMYYKSVTPNSLNNLKLNPRKVMIDGEEYPLSLNVSTDGIVYVCVGDAVTPGLTHTVTMPETAGVKTTPSKGIYPLPTRTSFRFSATYSGAKPLVVRTNRKVNGQQEVLNGVKNANGEYEYIVPSVQQEVTLTFGPDVVANELLTAGTAVWSHGEKIYIRVERADIASIYSVAGQLVKRVDLPEGDTSIPMSRGAYVITLKDGSVHKVIVK